MWFTFYKEKEFYFIKTTIEDNEFRCLLTNLKYIWLEILPLEDVYSRFKVNTNNIFEIISTTEEFRF